MGGHEALPDSNLVFQLRVHSLGISGFELDPHYCQLPVAEEVQPERNSCPAVLIVVWIVFDSNYTRQTSDSLNELLKRAKILPLTLNRSCPEALANVRNSKDSVPASAVLAKRLQAGFWATFRARLMSDMGIEEGVSKAGDRRSPKSICNRKKEAEVYFALSADWGII